MPNLMYTVSDSILFRTLLSRPRPRFYGWRPKRNEMISIVGGARCAVRLVRPGKRAPRQGRAFRENEMLWPRIVFRVTVPAARFGRRSPAGISQQLLQFGRAF